LFITTNHIESLKESLIRPGRVDEKIMIDYADKDQIHRMFLNFYENETEFANEFKNLFDEKVNVSTASLQGHFLKYKDKPKDSILNFKNIQFN
jgi:mitochondrial chaperone BCS1